MGFTDKAQNPGFKDSGFKLWSGFRIHETRFRIQYFVGFRIHAKRRIHLFEFRIQALGFRIHTFGFMIHTLGFRIQL